MDKWAEIQGTRCAVLVARCEMKPQLFAKEEVINQEDYIVRKQALWVPLSYVYKQSVVVQKPQINYALHDSSYAGSKVPRMIDWTQNLFLSDHKKASLKIDQAVKELFYAQYFILHSPNKLPKKEDTLLY